ncbi:MAG: DUF167 domain-containing protein [Spirochaetia bacterium]|nr:DUF167 domain-containing protein [Spirochaetia bacterium]
MIINVKAHTNSSEKKILIKDETFHVYIHIAAEKGKANKELIKLIAEYFKVPLSKVKIIKGLRSRSKKVEVL